MPEQVRLSLIVLYASGETLLAFMNHFPLFSLMLRIKDPQRLPGEFHIGVHKWSYSDYLRGPVPISQKDIGSLFCYPHSALPFSTSVQCLLTVI